MSELSVEGSELHHRYAYACSEFAARARKLADAAGGIEADAFIRLWDQCEDARRMCMELRNQISRSFVERNLTSREMEVLRLAAEGLGNKEIAETLGISVKTVEFHKHAIYERLSVRGTAFLV